MVSRLNIFIIESDIREKLQECTGTVCGYYGLKALLGTNNILQGFFLLEDPDNGYMHLIFKLIFCKKKSLQWIYSDLALIAF